MKNFEKEIEIRWSDTDPNRHVRHSAYYEYGAHTRIRFFLDHGYTSAKMNELNIGPILFKEECSFIREIFPEDIIKVNLLKGEMSEDASRWVLHHEIFSQEGEKKAHITVKGAWIDLTLRKLTTPPADLAEAFHSLPEGDYYTYSKKKE